MTEETKKFILNKCYGGFGFSDEAMEYLIEKKGWTVTEYSDEGDYVDESAMIVRTDHDGSSVRDKYYFTESRRSEEIRTHPDLVELVEERPVRVDGDHASLEVVEIPADLEWELDEYDGIETLREKHRTW